MYAGLFACPDNLKQGIALFTEIEGDQIFMTLQNIAEKYRSYQITMRRYFHANPELSEREFQTNAVIKLELDRMHIPWRPCGMKTGILATIIGAKPGKTILLRCDMDALEIQEETDLPYSSKKAGIMHACGHDCHIAMLLTAAHILNDLKDELCGTVKLAFQPAEEITTGALSMINDGALEGVDACFAIHVWSDIDSGKVVCHAGPCMAAVGKFTACINGKSGHGGAPQLCVDPMVAAGAAIMNLQAIVSRELSPQDSACLTIGSIHGGTCYNTIADSVTFEGTTRTFNEDISNSFADRIERIVCNAAQVFRAEASVTYEKLTSPVVNNATVTEVVQKAAEKVMGADAIDSISPLSAGEDFCHFMKEVPGALALLGVRNDTCGAVWPQHSNKYCVDEDALLYGAMLYAQVALDFNGR